MGGRITARETNSHWFNLFNAVASQAAMGAPMILLATSLQASSLFLGVLAALSPLGMLLQLPTARVLHVSEYRTTLLVGWSLRTVFIFLIAAIPLVGFLDPEAKRGALLVALATFNALRGISTAAWWPWIAELIPEPRRGRFLARDQLFTYAGGVGALAVYGTLLGSEASGTAFAGTFLLGGVFGLISLGFLARMPRPDPARRAVRPGDPVEWRTALARRPFVKLVGVNLVLALVIGSLNVFTVQFLRDVRDFSPESILYLSAITLAGPLAALPLLGRLVDLHGPGLVLLGVLVIYCGVVAGWFAIALGLLPSRFDVVAMLQISAGIASAAFNVANIHMVLKVIPEVGRNRFLAVFTVVSSSSLGAAPVLFGWLLDALDGRTFVLGRQLLGPHAVYFSILFVLTAAGAIAASPWLLRQTAQRAS